jgi:hypothetical protein
MPIFNPAAQLQAGTYTAQLDRLHQITTRHLPTPAAPFDNKVRGGVLSYNKDATFVINVSPVWSATFGPVTMLVENDFATNGGDYIVVKRDNDVVTFTPSSPTTNRIDTVAIQVVDAFYSGAVSEGRLVVVEGVATAGTPVAPTLPSSCEPLIDFLIAASSTAPTISVDRRKRSGLMGSIVPISFAQLGDAGAYSGETQYYEPNGTFRVWRHAPINEWRAFGGMLARGGTLLSTSWNLTDGQDGNISQVILNDPGGIWTCLAGIQMEYSWSNGARVDLNVSRNGINNGTIFGTTLPLLSHPSFPVSFAQMAGVLSGVLTGTQTIYFNVSRLFGGATVITATPFNFRATAVQLLLRAP